MRPPTIVPCDPQRWLRAALSPSTVLTFPFAGYGGNDPAPYVTGRRVLGVHLVWIMEKGTFPIRIGERLAHLHPGSLLWIPPGHEHEAVVPGEVVQYAVRISLTRHGRPLGLTLPPMILDGCGDLAPLAAQLISTQLRPGAFHAARQRALVAALGAATFERAAQPQRLRGGLREDQRQRLAQLTRDPRAHPSVAALARSLGLTTDYFTRVFRTSYGMPPRAWLVHERLAGTRVALARGGLIKEVAHQFGYRDPHLFSRQFRQAFGMSPAQWRRSADRSI